MDFDASIVWKGQHTFLKPVLFTSGQAFNGANLKFSNQLRGTISFFDGKEWCGLNVVTTPQALVIVNGLPTWGNVDASIIKGTIGTEHGGTGISKFDIGAMIYATSKNGLSKLCIGQEQQILLVKNNLPTWEDFPGIKGRGKSSYLAVFSSENDVCATNIQVDNSNLILKSGDSSIKIGSTSLINEDNSFSIIFGKDAVVITKDTFSILRNNKTLVKFWKGRLTHGVVPVTQVEGKFGVLQGGTGLSIYSPGDIIYASDIETLSLLSIENSDGFFLKSVNGRPQWSPMSTSDSSQTTSTTMSLLSGTTHRAPLQFQLGELTISPQSGAVEWDGLNMYVTTNDKRRKSIVFHGDNITASAKGVTEVVPVSMGGTGRDLSNSTVGGLLFVDSSTSIGFMAPERGQFLRIKPDTNLPVWSHAVIEIVPEIGILINKSNKYTPKISIDQAFSPTWLGSHVFVNGLSLGKETTLIIPQNLKSSLPQLHFEQCGEPLQKKNGDMWFNDDLFMYVNGATVNITASQSKAQSVAQVQHLRICEGISPVSNTKLKIKYPLPYGSDGHTRVKWRFVRADLRIEESPSENDAKLQIYVNGESILENQLTVIIDSQETYTQQFIMPYAYSGDLISIEFGETGGSDCWGLYLTIISDN